MIEGGSVETEQLARSLTLDGGSSGGIVHESQFSEEVTSLVGLEVGLFSIDDLEAIVLTLVDDVESVSLFSLGDDGLAGLGVDFFHGIDDDSEIFLIE